MTKTRKATIVAITDEWWRDIETGWELTPTHRMLIAAGKQAWQRWQEAKRLVDRDGLLIQGRKGAVRINPAVTLEARARQALVQVLSYLDLGQPEGS